MSVFLSHVAHEADLESESLKGSVPRQGFYYMTNMFRYAELKQTSAVSTYLIHPWMPHIQLPSGTTVAFDLELMSSDGTQPPQGVLTLNHCTLQLVG